MPYDYHTFIEILCSEPRIKHLRQQQREEFVFQVFEGMRGNVVMVDSTDMDDYIPKIEAIGLLEDLGLADQVHLFFPSQQPE